MENKWLSKSCCRGNMSREQFNVTKLSQILAVFSFIAKNFMNAQSQRANFV